MSKYAVYITIAIVAFYLGWLLKPAPGIEVVSQKEKVLVKNTETTTATSKDSVINTVLVESEKPGKTLNGEIFSQKDSVAVWDTTTTDGFKAKIRYNIFSNRFNNRFEIPVKTVTIRDTVKVKETEYLYQNISTVSAETTDKTSPLFLEAGYSAFYHENELNTMPFLSGVYESNILFFNTTIRIRAYFENFPGEIKINPYTEITIKTYL